MAANPHDSVQPSNLDQEANSGRRPWHRRRKESDKAYAAFRTYLELGQDRTYGAVCKELYGAKKNHRMIQDWGRRFQWVARAQEYDSHQAALEHAAYEREVYKHARTWAERRIKLRDKEWEVYEKMIDKVLAMLKFPLAEQTKSQDGTTIIIKPAKWSLSTVAQLAEVALRLGRLATDQPTEHTAVENKVTKPPTPSDHRVLKMVEAMKQAAETGKELPRLKKKPGSQKNEDSDVLLHLDG